jgi:hypothetical protein
MKKGFVVRLVFLAIVFGGLLATLANPLPPKIVTVTKEIEKITYFTFPQISFSNLETTDGGVVLHERRQLDITKIKNSVTVPYCSFTTTSPEIIVGYKFESPVDHNIDFWLVAATKRSTIVFSFYYWEHYGEGILYIKNTTTDTISKRTVEINCIPPG